MGLVTGNFGHLQTVCPNSSSSRINFVVLLHIKCSIGSSHVSFPAISIMESIHFEHAKVLSRNLQLEIQLYLDNLEFDRFRLVVESTKSRGERVVFHLFEKLGDIQSSRLYGVVDVSTESGVLYMESSLRRIKIFGERLIAG